MVCVLDIGRGELMCGDKYLSISCDKYSVGCPLPLMIGRVCYTFMDLGEDVETCGSIFFWYDT